MDMKAKRAELKDKAVQIFGFEHPTTIFIFTADKWLKDDVTAVVAMESALLHALKESEDDEDDND